VKHSTKDGQKLGYTQLLSKLKDERKKSAARDAALVDTITRFCGGDLEKIMDGWFRYKKGGKTITVSEPTRIVLRWRELLEKEPRLCEEWKRWLDDGAGVQSDW
jgi:hypothetical protein